MSAGRGQHCPRDCMVPAIGGRTGDGQIRLAILDGRLLQDLGELGTNVSGGLISVIGCALGCKEEAVSCTYVVGGATEYLSTIRRCCREIENGGRRAGG